MSNRRPVAKTSWFSVALIVAAVALWAVDQNRSAGGLWKYAAKKIDPESTGAYEIYRDCTLVEARNNDGDSFILRLPDGREAEFRLYFVDSPESAFKSYAGGHTNHDRIRQQAADLGGIPPGQAVEIGKQAKAYTHGLLENGGLTVFTRWDSPFHDNRFHAFVRVSDGGDSRWLHEILIEHGLARIKTKAADLPDGTPAARQRGKLRELESTAKRNRVGVWGL